MSGPLFDVPAAVLTPEELLGPLNDHELKYAPERLFVAGDRRLARRPKVAIVGTRHPSPQGLKRAGRLARELAEAEVVVVSGLAAGIDRQAHDAAIARGRTMAVLGTPLDEVTPRAHERLQREIMIKHLAISQFPPGHQVNRSCFPLRNRTMALVSDATVIVEAGSRSGTEHQGWEAIRLGRPLFVLRSLVAGHPPDWVRKMLDYGAMELSATEDLLRHVPDPSDEQLAAHAAF